MNTEPKIGPEIEIDGLRNEIIGAQAKQMDIPFRAAIAMIILAFAAEQAQLISLAIVNALFGGCVAFFCGRMDFIIHRIGRYLELSGSPYEKWKADNRRVLGLIFYDLTSALVIIITFCYNERILVNLGAGDGTIAATISFFILGVVSIPIAPKIAGR